MSDLRNGVSLDGRGARAIWRHPAGDRRCLLVGPREERARSHVEGRGRNAEVVPDPPEIVQPVLLVERAGLIGQRPTRVAYAPVSELSGAGWVDQREWPPELWEEFEDPPAHLPELDLDARPTRETGWERTQAWEGA